MRNWSEQGSRQGGVQGSGRTEARLGARQEHQEQDNVGAGTVVGMIVEKPESCCWPESQTSGLGSQSGCVANQASAAGPDF